MTHEQLKDLNLLLDRIDETVLNYRNLNDLLVFEDKQLINGMMKNLSCDLDILEGFLDDERELYYDTYFFNVEKKGFSSTEAEKRAKHRHPLKRKLERRITSANKVFESMRSNQSFLKKE